MTGILVYAAKNLITYTDTSADLVAKSVIRYALCASVASLTAGAITGGSLAASVVLTGFVWALYRKLTKLLDIPFSKHFLRTVAMAILADISGTVASYAAAFAISFIPVFGNVASSVICSVTSFIAVYVAGYVFIKTLAFICHKDTDFSSLSAEDFRNEAENATGEKEIKEVIKEAKKVYKQVKDDDEYKDFSDIKEEMAEVQA